MSNSRPLVSVIVPSYNAAGWLPYLCRSLQAQTFTNFEVLIGDDGSTDNTHAVLAPFLADARFRLIAWKPNAGLTQGVLTLLDQVRGEYWAGIAADDEFKPEFLSRRVALMEAQPLVSLIHGPPELIDAEGRPLPPGAALGSSLETNRLIYGALERNVPLILKGDEALRLLLAHNVISAPTVMVRSAVTRRILSQMQLDWRYAQDWYLWLLHVATGTRLAFDPVPAARYRVHGGSMSNDPAKEALRKAEIRLIPLLALSIAAEFSFDAADLWGKYRRTLYARWLKTALGLQRAGTLNPAWLQRGAAAFYGRGCGDVSLWRELACHAWSIGLAERRESAASADLCFSVSGLAQCGRPFFSKTGGSNPPG